MNSPTLRTAENIHSEMTRLLEQASREGSFNRERESQFNSLLRLHEISSHRSGPVQIENLSRKAITEHLQRTIDPSTVAFFCGRQPEEREVSVSGGVIERSEIARIGGRPAGAMTLLRDYSSALSPEHRTYAGLTTATGGVDGGSVVPVGFIPTVFAAMKRTDQIVEAANWDVAATVDGRGTNLPSLTDTGTSAIKVAEAGAMSFANPSAFGNTAWPDATTWTSQVIQASVQLDTDAGVRLAGLLADAFRIRFARGFGAEVVSIVLADAPTGATTVSATAITQADLLELIKSVDPAYACADTAGFCMNWNTLVYVFEHVITSASSGDAMFHAKRDDRGHYLLFGKPVFVSPSLADIGTSAVPVLFGDFSRLLIRHVPNQAVVRRYDELYMASMKKGFEMLFRADAKIMHAGGSGDDPLKALACHS